MADVELLPLPEHFAHQSERVQEHVRAYARANLAPLQAENERLREALNDADNELDWLDEDMDTCDHSVGVCTCSYWSMRRKMKTALAKENSND